MISLHVKDVVPLVLLFNRRPAELLKNEREQLISHMKCQPSFLPIYPRSAEEYHVVCCQQKPSLVLLPYVGFHETKIPLPFMPFSSTLASFEHGYFDYDPSPCESVDAAAFRYREYEPGVTQFDVTPIRMSA